MCTITALCSFGYQYIIDHENAYLFQTKIINLYFLCIMPHAYYFITLLMDGNTNVYVNIILLYYNYYIKLLKSKYSYIM